MFTPRKLKPKELHQSHRLARLLYTQYYAQYTQYRSCPTPAAAESCRVMRDRAGTLQGRCR